MFNQDHIFYKVSGALCSLTIIMAFVIYVVRQDVADVRKQITTLNGDIVHKRQSVTILQTEWSHLNSPNYLKKINDHVVKFENLLPKQTKALSV
ncbi:MAG: hypothetical protein OXC30_00890 [Alphaproteobacteria bacterium]|nr:hypothetical protein [Alphaproteobacteria bacterium]